jgi:secreted PhoX family phosphatase
VGIAGAMPAWRPDASNSAADQAVQMGMHHDGMPSTRWTVAMRSLRRGLLAINHEYTDDGLLHPDGSPNWNAEKVRKAQNAHGVSVIEVALKARPLADGAAVPVRAPHHRWTRRSRSAARPPATR